jgi:uncharacterized membrane protein
VKNKLWFVLFFVALPFGYAAYLYPSLGDQIPIHFDINGKPNDWASRNSIFISPVILGFVTFFTWLLLTNIEKIDPKRAGQEENRSIKNLALFLSGALCVLNLVILYGTTHKNVAIDKLIFGSLGFLFMGLGYFMPKLKQNYFAGYRLPWTLENEKNWKQTHQLAGPWWIGGGVSQVVLAIALKGQILFYIFMAITILVALVPAIYSYLQFKRTKE